MVVFRKFTHNLHRCARSEGASGRCSSSFGSMIGVCVRKDVEVWLVDGRGGRRGGNWSRNEQNATFKTPFVLHAMPHGREER